ncbi:TonB-dependent receptor [Silvibacterium acidisoli]|uniref:TonB-dependent receptor n=1 Tax=Acidobacteriaceae bacterium ZG23-2 TaxID=2883246 RepID=UPI00406C1FE9
MPGRVVDAKGNPVAGAVVADDEGHSVATTGADGRFSVPAGTGRVSVSSDHFAPAEAPVPSTGEITVVLEQPLEQVIVSAYRSPLASADSPASTRVMEAEQLHQSASASLDGRLREVPGFELFRRSSSLVANPTTEGISLRGLGSTAVSRSLVVYDDVPMNDPYGGWIHWGEIPQLDIRSVEVVRGGASDLYGSSAIGGVISILPYRPAATAPPATFVMRSTYGGLETVDSAAQGTFHTGKWSGIGSWGLVATDGYTLVAPDVRGPVDRASNVHSINGLAELDRQLSDNDRIFVRGSVVDETRHNGTPLTGNGTRLWRYVAGTDWKNVVLRLYGDNEHYWQTFSTLAAGRVSETLTRYAEDPAAELGAAAHWHQAIGNSFIVLAGADTHDVRASDDETLYTSSSILSTTARQRQTGVYGEALYTPRNWTLSGSARVDHFSNFDVLQFTGPQAHPGGKSLPSFSETVFDPRLGVTRRLGSHLALNASGFRAYRAPTENELYRTGQVGQQVTEPNANLRSERATGWETGFQLDMPQWGSSLRASYFWTRVNRPITALTLSTTPTQTLLQRENLGRIESRGVSLDYAVQPARWIAIQGGYQYADATVTAYTQQPQLVGNWIPQVARNMATAQVKLTHPKLGLLSLQERASGRQFDDDKNLYLLHSYFTFDAYASRDFGRHWQLFASGENLFDRAVEVGKTPVLTLGSPRVARMGLQFKWGE